MRISADEVRRTRKGDWPCMVCTIRSNSRDRGLGWWAKVEWRERRIFFHSRESRQDAEQQAFRCAMRLDPPEIDIRGTTLARRTYASLI